MSFAIPKGYEAPSVPVGAQWVFHVRVKAFEENTLAQLDAVINAWLLVAQADPKEHAILDVKYQSGAKERALVTFGAFVNVNDL